MFQRLALVLGTCFALVGAVRAQDIVFVQVQANRSLVEATAGARDFASRLPDVNGFSMGGGWYAVALGPYERADAEQVLRVYRAERVIPSDSFLSLPVQYGRQFWPVGQNILRRGALVPPTVGAATPAPQVPAPAAPEPAAQVPAPPEPDETPREAQASERLLSADERRELQIALQWAGTYQGAIDGAYGRGTRNAMATWQEQNGFDKTGILSTRQRAMLLQQFNAVLEGLNLAEVTDEEAGIAMTLPTAAVTFARRTAPFVQYDASGVVPEAKVLLISQPGTQETLFGLYEIMQTLEMVPLDGPRERRREGFSITGENASIVSETRVALRDGQIKGFTLVWPRGDEDRRTRLLAEMEKSFVRLAGVLPLELAIEQGDVIDLGEGLEIRKPRLSRSGFFVNEQGDVVTTSTVVQGCARLTLDNEIEASLLADNPEKGVAVLRPDDALAPIAVARFSPQSPRRASEIAIAGYSFEGTLGAPTMSYGTLSDLKGLSGEADQRRLAVSVLPGDAGGPVLDSQGGVFGMLLPRLDSGGRELPEDVQFVTDAQTIRDSLAQAGVTSAAAIATGPLDPIDLGAAARGMTVLVNCWD